MDFTVKETFQGKEVDLPFLMDSFNTNFNQIWIAPTQVTMDNGAKVNLKNVVLNVADFSPEDQAKFKEACDIISAMYVSKYVPTK